MPSLYAAPGFSDASKTALGFNGSAAHHKHPVFGHQDSHKHSSDRITSDTLLKSNLHKNNLKEHNDLSFQHTTPKHFKVTNFQTYTNPITPPNSLELNFTRIAGSGAFGVVFQAILIAETPNSSSMPRTRNHNYQVETAKSLVAVKKVAQDSRFKNRELQIMQSLTHPHIVKLLHSFYSNENGTILLNLVLEYVPETLASLINTYSRRKSLIPFENAVKLISHVFKALEHLHSLGICHRDIKPQNFLVDPETCTLKLADFGSAKPLKSTEPSISYICSRFYRAPELVFASRFYSTAVDVWGAGCVLAEVFIGSPLFPGKDQLAMVIDFVKILGVPSTEDLKEMNPQNDAADESLLMVLKSVNRQCTLKDVISQRLTDQQINLVVGFLEKALKYSPVKRVNAKEALKDNLFLGV